MRCETAQYTWFVENRRKITTEFDSDVLHVQEDECYTGNKEPGETKHLFLLWQTERKKCFNYRLYDLSRLNGVDGRRMESG